MINMQIPDLTQAEIDNIKFPVYGTVIKNTTDNTYQIYTAISIRENGKKIGDSIEWQVLPEENAVWIAENITAHPDPFHTHSIREDQKDEYQKYALAYFSNFIRNIDDNYGIEGFLLHYVDKEDAKPGRIVPLSYKMKKRLRKAIGKEEEPRFCWSDDV